MTIATKRMIKIVLWMLLIAMNVVGFMAVSNVSKNGSYTVDTQEFNSVIEWGEDVSIDDVKIIDNRVFGLVKTTLTEDMIVSIEDTDTAGQKKIVFEHNKKQFTVIFDVKYKIEFVAYGKVIDTQMVVTPDELNLPTPDAKTGFEFSHWDYDFSQGFTRSVKIDAVFKETKYPALTMLDATYGDTLADLTLPSDERGHWEFIDTLDTPVGNVGKNFFNVRFVFNGDDSYYKYSEIEVKVDKKELNFTVNDNNNVFVYDGLAHSPTYSLDTEVDSVVIHGGEKVDAGTYGYRLEIVDDRYFGEYYGNFEITKPTVTVNVSSEVVEFATNLVLPQFTYTVEGFERIDLLNIEIALPERTAVVGQYEVGINLETANQNVNYVVNKGTLTILQADFAPEDVPKFRYEPPTYGDKLEDLVITGFYQGEWDIETKDANGNDIIFDNTDSLTVYATYTPHNTNYKPIRVELEITEINKKELTIIVLQKEFTFEEGIEYKLIYKIVDEYGNEYPDLAVLGNDLASLAGSYLREIVIDDDNYCGSVDEVVLEDGTVVPLTLTINKATPNTEFDKPLSVVWKEGLKLEDVTLPAGYSWKLSSTSINGIGGYTFEAIYTPVDQDNYLSITGAFNVTVNPATPIFVNLLDAYSKNYDTFGFDIKNSNISALYMMVKPVIKYYKGNISIEDIANAEEIDEIINVGTYTVVIYISANGNYHETTVRRTVTVIPGENPQDVLTQQTGKYLDNTAEKLTLPENIEGTWSWSIPTLNEMGQMTLTAIYTPDSNGNYNPRTETVTVTVEKKPLEVPTIKSKEYTGEWIDIEYSDNDIYTVSGDLSAQDYGTYYVTFTLVEPDKFEWIGSENQISVEVSYKITQAPNNWITEPANKITAPYNPNGGYVFAEADHGTPTYIYKTLDGTVVEGPINVGKYKVTILVEPDNYEHLEKTIDLEVTVITVPVPNGNALVYNGSAQGVTITNDNLGKLYDYVSGSYVSKTNAGEAATVVVRLKDSTNYKWDKVSGSDYTVSVTIAKATLSFAEGSATTITGNSTWTYTETECGFVMATLSDASASLGVQTILKYSTDNVKFFTAEEFNVNNKTNGLFNAGTYYVKTVALGSDNWNEISTDSVSFKVNKATPDFITANWTGGVAHEGLYYQNLLEFKNFKVYFGEIEVAVEEITSSDYVLIGGFNGANTKLGFNVTPIDSKNFEATELEFADVIPLKDVAKIYRSGSVVATYGTIEDALENAKSGDTVWVNADNTGNVYIKDDTTIPIGVTLVLPFGNYTDKDGGKNSSDEATVDLIADNRDTPDVNEREYYVLANSLSEKYRKTWVKIASGVTLTVKGTLDIAGEMTGGGGGNMSGHTAGRYATLELEDGAKVEATGTIKCYGFIENVDGNDNGNLILNAGANIYLPFVLHDFKGGTIMSGIYYDIQDGNATTPFHQFNFPNVSIKIRVNYGAQMTMMCNLESNDQTNHTTALLIGSANSPLIQLTEQSSYLEAKYDPKTQITDLDIYGGARLNSMSLSLSVKLVGDITVSSETFVFGLSWLYDITLDNAEGQSEAVFTMTGRYKMLPGSKLTVEAGAKLIIEDTLTIYDNTFVDRLGGEYPNTGLYPTVYPATSSLAGQNLPSAIFIVRGTVEAVNLAGNVYADSGNAVVIVSGNTTVSILEPTVITRPIFAGQVDEHQTVTRYLKFIYTDGVYRTDGNLNELYAISAIIRGDDGIANYTSDSTNQKWTTDAKIEFITITLPKDVHITIDSIVLVDDEGNVLDFGSYDSTAGGVVNVVAGTIVTFHLRADQLVVADGSTTYKLASAADIKTTDYTYEWPASTGTMITIYSNVPVVNLSGYGSLSECSVTYKDLGTSSCYVEIYMYKEVSTIKVWNKVTASFSVTATKSTTTGIGSFSKTQYAKASVNTTVVVYENDTIKVS